MLNVSSAFKNALANDWRKYLISATITLQDNTVLTITNEDLMATGNNIEDGLCDDSSFGALGGAPIGSITLRLNNVDASYSEYDFTRARVVLQIGLRFEDDTTEMINRGEYYVETPTYTDTAVTLYCLDNMYRLDYPYDSDLVYPASLGTIVRDICTEFGLDLNTQNFPQNSFVVNESPANGQTTYREVLSWCAEIAGCYARCDVSGGIIFGWYDQTILEDYYDDDDESRMIPLNSISEQNLGLDDIIITGVVLNREEEETTTVTQTLPDGTVITYDQTSPVIHTYAYGTTDYAIELNGKNGFITATNAQSIVDRIGAQLTGIRYRKANISHLSLPYMQAGDIAIMTDRKQNKHVMLITRTVFTFGSYQQTASAGKTVAQNSSVQYSALTKQYSEARQEIYKEVQARQEAVAELAAKISDNASGLYATQVESPPHSGSYIYYYHNKPDLEDSDIQLVFSTVGFTVTANGTDPNPTWYGLTVDGQLIASILNTTGVNADWINTGQLSVHKTVGSTEVEMLFVDCDTGTVRISDQVQAIDDARKVATNYLTYNANVGLDVGYNGTSAKTRITGGGVEIFDENGASAAEFSASGVRVGESGKHRVELSSDKLEFINEDATTVGEMGTAEDATFSVIGEIVFTGHPEDEDHGGTSYGTFDVETAHEPITPLSAQNKIHVVLNLIYINSGNARVPVNYVDIEQADTEYEMLAAVYYEDVFWVNFYIQYVSADNVIRIRTNPLDGKVYSLGGEIDFEFTADYNYAAAAPYYTFGTRQAGDNKGAYSVVAGYNNEASGFTAFAEGENNEATGQWSHASGYGTLTSGNYSTAEGFETVSKGVATHASGVGTIASGLDGQVVIGKYNVENPDWVFIVGNGADNSNRSDMLILDKNSKIDVFGAQPRIVLNSSYSSKIGEEPPSSGVALGYNGVFDKNGDMCAYSDVYRGQNDQLRRGFMSTRKNASGTRIQNGFFLLINNDDSLGVEFSSTSARNAWVSALGLGDTTHAVNGSATSVQTAKDTTLCSTGSLSAGQYIIVAEASFAANTSGRRVIFLTDSNTGANLNRFTILQQAPSPSNTTILSLTYLARLSSATTFYLRAYQNSGSTLSVTGGIDYIKLHN